MRKEKINWISPLTFLFYIGLDILIYGSKERENFYQPENNEKSHRICLSFDQGQRNK